MKEKTAAKRKAAFRPAEPTPTRAGAGAKQLTSTDWRVLVGILVVSSFVRLYGLAWPPSVVFDEVHFGGFARKYIIGRFFFDLHPPLAKMLFAVVGWMGGYDGEFEFANIGDDYISANVPYVFMRMFPALCGLFTIVLAFATLRASGVRTSIAACSALMLTFENTHATESRFILLDSPLIFFMALAAYAFKKFELQTPFSRDWFRYLLLTGLTLGATVSSKWVGLFTIAWVGLLTVYQLWWLWGDLTVPVRKFWGGHVAARGALLIVVPALFYVAMFWLHFFCVDNIGDGADFMPRAFLANLKHNDLPTDIPADVSLGSLVSIRHLHSNGGYLHSHASSYETGSKQQQVTLYPHLDENNLWRIENATDENNFDLSQLNFLEDGSLVRFMHEQTQKRLHSHDHRAPVSTQDYINEVSGYGFEGFEGDPNDNWRVKVISKQSKAGGKKHMQAIRTVFQLEHALSGCLLYARDNARLPAWGFEQQEVSCIRNGKEHNTLWYVEHNENELLPEDAETVSYEPLSFLEKFIHLNKVMWSVNKGLTESHTWESRPESWLFLTRGINMWGQDHLQVYLIGNRPIYWGIALSMIAFVVGKLGALLWWQRYSEPGASFAPVSTAWGLFDHHFGNYLLAWFLHYAPSFLMVRQLFLHHYLASVYFGILMLGQLLELTVSVARPQRLTKAIPYVAVVVAVAWYVWYSPLVYAKAWTHDMCVRSKFGSMDFDCDSFFGSYDEYKEHHAKLMSSMARARLGLPQETATEPEQPDNQNFEASEANEAYEAYDDSNEVYQEQEQESYNNEWEHVESEPLVQIVDDAVVVEAPVEIDEDVVAQQVLPVDPIAEHAKPVETFENVENADYDEKVFVPTEEPEAQSEHYPESATEPIDDPQPTADAGYVDTEDIAETLAANAGAHYEGNAQPEEETIAEPEETAI